ncbi:hypothetical protein TRIP_B200250 [uncultured Desulfatiglans sp.]|uniref:Transposase IS66 central domain-containing protein n=1 Tax=Uncultured Desulfatiglans sp. TaxID=1748965 RepID=A0A653A253_UNCDX|nr:hypothetical protein TRIP_B200250 [uncultured Desulfatiglans sp.]
MKKSPQKLKISAGEFEAPQDRIKERNLTESDYDVLLGLAETVARLREVLAEKENSIGRLCKYLLGAPTETARNILKDKAEPVRPGKRRRTKTPRPRKNGADLHTGAARVRIEHPAEGHQVAMFMTHSQHAGKNLHDLLKRRATGLPPPIQMCDALNRNVSEDFQTILANCLAHARRKFVELVDRFPDDCAHVINELATVYVHEAIARTERNVPRGSTGLPSAQY